MFFTEVKIKKIEHTLSHADKVWTIGSCFSDEIGSRMANDLFNVKVNPCGTLYNPCSIHRTLTRIVEGELYHTDDLFQHNGQWHCADFHSSFSGTDQEAVLTHINATITTLHNELPGLNRLIVTFGSARAFVDRASNRVVGNCHKLPADRFDVRDLQVGEIVAEWSRLCDRLKAVAPQLRVMFTVSPIRHKAYGYHADKLSKATLLLAVDELCKLTEADYFPSYEIMTDELRDYRFYAADMIHPSATACGHIYNRLGEAMFTPATVALAGECRKLSQRLQHRALGGDTEEYRAFVAATRRKAEALLAAHPELKEIFLERQLLQL
jgi:hypothetical protein